MSQAEIIDLVTRDPVQEPIGQDEGTVLSVVPIPGVEAALIIVGHVVPLARAKDARRVPGVPPSGQPAMASPAVHPSQAVQAIRSAQTAQTAQNARAVQAAQTVRHAGDFGADEFVVDRAARLVRVGGEDIELTYREFELLDYLCAAPGRVYNRRQILAAVWDRYGDESARTVDVHILRIRRKLGRHAGRIVTVRNVGYKYQPARPA